MHFTPKPPCGSLDEVQSAREEFLIKLRNRAQQSSAHGDHVRQLTSLVLGNIAPTSNAQRPSAASSGEDSDDDDVAPAPMPQKVFDEERIERLQSELLARIRASQANAANFARNSAVSKVLPVERVTLVEKPDCIHNIGSLGAQDGKPQTQLFEEQFSFFGIWFTVAAAVRFLRPLRRKRGLDAQIERVQMREKQAAQLEQLKHAGLAHDTRRTARQQLRQAVARSETEILQHQCAAVRPSTTKAAPVDQERGGGDGSVSPRTGRLAFTPVSIPLHRLLTPRAADANRGSSSNGATAGSSFEAKAAVRDTRRTAQRLTQGTSACGSLGKTITQHTRSADPSVLAHFMLNALTAQARNAESQRNAHHQLPTTHDAVMPSESAALPPLAPVSSLQHRKPLPPPLAEASLTQSMSIAVVQTPSARKGATPESARREAKPSPRAFAGGSGTYGAASTPRRYTNDATPVSISSASPTTDQTARSVPSLVRMDSERRRDALAGGSLRQVVPLTLRESDFVDVPLPKLSATSAQAYPPAATRPAPPRRRDSASDVELAFMRRVDANGFHEDVCRRLQHAEMYRARDFELKRSFLQHYAHGDDAGVTVHTLVRELASYIDAKRRQDARLERHALRIKWFHRFYEEMVERCNWSELEVLFLKMEEQILDEFSLLQYDNFKELFDLAASTQDALSLPAVQFFLCHVAVAYGVAYTDFRELLELQCTPYILHGNGEHFLVAAHQSATAPQQQA